MLPVMSRLHLPALSLFCGNFDLFAILNVRKKVSSIKRIYVSKWVLN